MVNRIRLRRDAAACHQFDLVGALANFVTHRFTHFGDAIGDPAEPEAREMRCALAGLELIGGSARVAVPAGLTDRPTGDEQARPSKNTVFHRLAMSSIGTTRIAHSGKSAQQHAFECGERMRRDQRRQHLRCCRQNERMDMDVTVDQARHQSTPTEIDLQRTFCIDRTVFHGCEPVIPHQDLVPVLYCARLDIEQSEVFEENAGIRHALAYPWCRIRVGKQQAKSIVRLCRLRTISATVAAPLAVAAVRALRLRLAVWPGPM